MRALPLPAWPFRGAVVLLLAAGAALGAQAPAPLRLRVKAPDYRLELAPRAYAPGQRPLVLALGGGAAKGIAHVGVLQRLEEEGLPVDGIAGTSMGAFMGAMYASGYSGFAIQRLFERVDVGALLMDRQHRRPGETLWEQEHERTTFLSLEFVPGTGVLFMPGTSPGLDLKRALQVLLARPAVSGADSFDGLRVPFRAVSTDLQAGRAALPDRGDLGTAVRASMSIPGVFSPVLLGDHQHVDGMLVQNLPVEAARSLPVKGVVVAVEVGQALDSTRLTSVFALAVRSLDVSVEERTEISRKAADLLLRPRTDALPYLDFHQMVDRAVAEGRRAFDGALDALEQRIYGPEGEAPFPAGPVTVVAPEPLGAQVRALVRAGLPEGPRLRRHGLRVLRRIQAAGFAREAEWTFTPAGPVLTVTPQPVLRALEVQAAGDWGQLARTCLEGAGLREGAAYNPVALGRALDAFLLETTIRSHPLVKLDAVTFDETAGRLSLRISEPGLPPIRVEPGILSPGQTQYLANLLAPFAGRPLEVDTFTRSVLLGEKRLGLEEIRLEADPARPRPALRARPIPDDRVIVDATFGYETTWQGHAAVDARAHRVFGTALGFSAEASGDRLWTTGGLRLTRALAAWPRVGLAVGARSVEQHLLPEVLDALFALDPRIPGLTGHTFREQGVATALFARVGLDDRGLVEVEGSRSWIRTQPGAGPDLAPSLYQVQARFEWDSFDRYLFPTEGFLVRTRFGQGRQERPGAPTAWYRFAYLRARRLWPVAPWGSVDADLESGLGWDLPLARYYPVGGPAFLAGTASAGHPTPNFAILRLGLPLHVVRVFGVNVQATPRLDAAYLGAASPHRLREAGAWVRAAGVSFRAELGRYYLELDAGRAASTDPAFRARTRVNLLVGTHPFDLWWRR
ncbi:patatin-like phospholipase family protein [Mesoterricola sediminis]|uniref:PNPLA domain-containing protein n=1 Tax=Mesoterricola sediminis TaxID=2927980 RepID=A0AA48GT51_9BACT|nr:patatin-like phospholipase family protein [Mesoterricola sediminis]BDU77112.1 hypothetical protein METESE_20700 [Mesoterricola sediminis]